MHHICCITQRLSLFRIIYGKIVAFDLTYALDFSTACYKILQVYKGSAIPPFKKPKFLMMLSRKSKNRKRQKSKQARKKGVSKVPESPKKNILEEGIESKMRKCFPTEIEVTTVRCHTTAIKCPCRTDCGELVKLGTYGANGGCINGCPHGPTNSGCHWHISVDFISHV